MKGKVEGRNKEAEKRLEVLSQEAIICR